MLGDSSHGSPLALILLFISQATPPGLFAEPSEAIAMKIGVPAGEHGDCKRQVIPGGSGIKMRFSLTSSGIPFPREAGKLVLARPPHSQGQGLPWWSSS